MVYVRGRKNTIAIRLGIAGVACCLAGTIALTQGQAPPPAPPAGDCLMRPPVVRLSPETQQKLFLLPPGYRIRARAVEGPRSADPHPGDSRERVAGTQPGAQGAGDTPTTIVLLPPTRAKVIRITQTGTAPNGEQWAVQQVRIYQTRGAR